MPRKKTRKTRGGKKITGARKKFGKVARAANATCHRESNSTATFRTCMRKEMRAGLKKEGFKVKRG